MGCLRVSAYGLTDTPYLDPNAIPPYGHPTPLMHWLMERWRGGMKEMDGFTVGHTYDEYNGSCDLLMPFLGLYGHMGAQGRSSVGPLGKSCQ